VTRVAQSHDRWMALIARGAFLLTYLQCVEVETLPTDGPVVVDVERDRDDFGFPRVDLLCGDRDELIAYVREHWGEEDPEWFQTYVVERIERIGGPVVGQTWRADTGGKPVTIVAVDERFAYVKSADASKKSLANPAGAQIVALSEFASWTPQL
jgi:hypothetical protein